MPLILRLIRSLAEYEKMADEAVATEADLERALFGSRPAAEVIIAYAGDEPAGSRCTSNRFRPSSDAGLYLEDIFVKPEWRKQGLGRMLLARLARIAVERATAGWNGRS